MSWLIPLDHFEKWERGVLQMDEKSIMFLALHDEIDLFCAGVELIEREIEAIMTSSKHYVNASKQFKGK